MRVGACGLTVQSLALCALLAPPALAAAPRPTAQMQGALLTSDPNPSAPGQAVTFTATYHLRGMLPHGYGAGRTLFSDNGVTLLMARVIATGFLSTGETDVTEMHATFTTRSLAVGTHIITAIYLDDSERAIDLKSVEQVVK
jgi:hypothetical protein